MSAKVRSLNDFLMLLKSVKQARDGQYMALCPAHNDRNPSLSVILNDSRILLKCFAGCQTEDVVKALGLTIGDLFLNSNKSPMPKREIAAIYPYKNAKGEVIFETVRYTPKTFKQRQPDGKGGYIWNLKGVRLLPYHLPEVIEAVAANRIILMAEGEKDVDNLRKLGFDSTCNPLGAGRWRKSYSDYFNGADVAVIADKDDPGRAHSESVAQSLHGKASSIKVLELPGESVKDASDWIEAGGTKEGLQQIIGETAEWQPTPETELSKLAIASAPTFNLTDYGNAERLVHLYGDIIRYSPERKAWLLWTGKVCEWDLGGVRITKLAKKTTRNIYREAADEPDDNLRKEIVSHARATERQVRLDAMIKSAESEPGIAVMLAGLDSNHWLLNVNNGTIDLRTGILKPHDRADLITELLPIDYDPDATSTEWDTFLRRIFSDNADLIAYVQRGMGYSITGDQSEQAFFFCYGSGFNGKSTLLNACRLVLGNYATQVPPTAFMVDKNKRGGPDEAIASLRNKRLVCSTELEDGQRLSVSLVKRMTGGEPLWCEHKFERGYNFQPTHKLWLSGNHEPVITDTTNSIWYRLKKIPFTIEIPETDRKKGYAEKLAAEHDAAILAWLVRGCVEWRRTGSLGEPEAVKQAVAEYREQQDILHDYLIERCIFQKSATIDQKSLYADYKQWAEDNDLNAIGKLTFRTRIQEKGASVAVGNRNIKIWRGIRLRTDDDDVTSVTDFSESLLREASTGKTLLKNGNKSNKNNTGELPDCPACGRNEWTYTADGELKCPCGNRFKGGTL